MVEALLPGSPLRPLLADVSAAGPVAPMQVEVDPQGEAPAKGVQSGGGKELQNL